MVLEREITSKRDKLARQTGNKRSTALFFVERSAPLAFPLPIFVIEIVQNTPAISPFPFFFLFFVCTYVYLCVCVCLRRLRSPLSSLYLCHVHSAKSSPPRFLRYPSNHQEILIQRRSFFSLGLQIERKEKKGKESIQRYPIIFFILTFFL